MPSKEDKVIKNPQENLERIAELLEKIEKHLAPPPLWQRSLKFTFEHLALILSVMAIAFFTWKMWGHISVMVGYVSDILEKIGLMTSAMDTIDEKFADQIKNLKFW